MKLSETRKRGILAAFAGCCACLGAAVGLLNGERTAFAAVEYAPQTVYESVVTEDAYVRSSRAGSNFSSEAITSAHGAQYVGKNFRVINVKHKSGNEIFAMMKFSLPTAQRVAELGIDTFELQFSVFKNADYNNGDQEYVFCYTTDNSWSESTVTWNNKPASIVQGASHQMAVLQVEKGFEYESKTDAEKLVRLDVTQSVQALIAAGEEEVTVFAYGKNDLETSLLIHAKETSAAEKRPRILGVKENIDEAGLRALVDEASGVDAGRYTQQSYEAYKQAFDAAQEVLKQPQPQTEQVISAFKALYSAYHGLVERDEENVAYQKAAHSNLNKQQAYKVTDGDEGSYWSGIFYPSYVDVDLGDNYDLTRVNLLFPSNKQIEYSLYASVDGAQYERVAVVHDAVNGSHTVTFPAPVRARILRVYLESTRGDDAAYLSEVRAYGTLAGGNSGALRQGGVRDELGIQPYAETEYAKPITDEEIIENVYGIIDRTIGRGYRSWFTFALTERESARDFFTIEMKEGKVHVSGNEGLSLTSGLNYYYKNYLNVHIAEQTMQINMPAAPVQVQGVVRKETDLAVRYAYNYCTLSYSYAFYDAEDWQRVYDWLALNGVNVVLDLAGQEATWALFLMNYGYSLDDAKDWISGPAYSAWQFMSNMEAFGGPVSDAYIVDRVALARSTQRWKNSLGMQTVLQGYAGMVPTNFNEFQPDVTLIGQGGWNGFDRPAMIATDSATYDEYAAKFYECQEYVYGKNNHYYAVDPFHEGGKRPSGLSDKAIAENVLDSLLGYDEQAVWVVQGWQSNPTNGLLEGMGNYRNTNVLVVDLIKYPISSGTKYNKTKYGSTTLGSKEFNGTNWAWTLLANFGGNPSMHGELEKMVADIQRARKTSSFMQGIGIISEAMNDNPVVYDLIFDLVWAEDAFNVSVWLDGYVERRYGGTTPNVRRAWEIMLDANYDYGVRFTSEVYGMKNKGPQGYKEQSIAYGADKLETALLLMLEDFERFKDEPCYRYDLSDILRQVVSNFSTLTYNEILKAKDARDLDAFLAAKEKFVKSLEVLNVVQATRQDQLAGEWIGKAQDMAADYDDFTKDVFEMQAKALITSWGSRKSNRSLKDYGWRNYEGMFADLYAPIWVEYLGKIEQNIRTGEAISNVSLDGYFEYYWEWNLSDRQYLREAKDSPEELYAAAQQVLQYCMFGDEIDADVGNLALGRAVSADGETDGWLQAATDGEEDTSVLLRPVGQEAAFTVDLIAEFSLTRVQLLLGEGSYTFRLAVSTDGRTWTELGEYTAAGSAEYEYTASGVRYLRITTSAELSLREVRVYGERELPELDELSRLVAAAQTFDASGDPTLAPQFESALRAAEGALKEQAPPDTVNAVYWSLYDAMAAYSSLTRPNLAAGKVATAHNDPSGNVARLVDGSTGSDNYWDSGRLSPTGKPYEEAITPGWAIIDLGTIYDLDGAKIYFGDASLWYNFELYVSENNTDWTLVFEKTDRTLAKAAGESIAFAPVRGRYVMLVTTNIANDQSGKRAGYRVNELEVYGYTPIDCDKTALNAAISSAERFKAEDYSQQSYQDLMDALTRAKLVAGDLRASQSSVNSALQVLNAAIGGLKAPTAPPPQEPIPPEPSTPSGGGGKDKTAAIVGGTLAGAAVLAGAAAAVLIVRKKKKK